MAYVLGNKIVKDTKEFDAYAYGITLPLKRGGNGYFEQAFTNYHTKYTICFPLADKIIFKSVDQILKLLPKSQLKSFPNDSIEYFEVQLN